MTNKTNIQLRLDFKKATFGKIDERNVLNNLTGKEWLQLTRSVWFSKPIKNQLFSPSDIGNLIKLFTKKSMIIINLTPNYDSINKIGESLRRDIKNIDILDSNIKINHIFHYAIGCIHFPNILNVSSENPEQIASQYKNFLSILDNNLKKVFDSLEDKKYLSLIINDFQIGKREINNTTNIIRLLQKIGFIFKGKIILALEKINSDFDKWFNNNHVFILNFQKNKNKLKKNKLPTELVIPSKFSLNNTKKLNLEGLNKTELLKYLSTVWISKTVLDKIGMIHPAPFSYVDIQKLISLFTEKNSTVIDPFVGVASTLIACGQTKRKGIGIDLNENYIELSKERLRQFNLLDEQELIAGDSLIEVNKIKKSIDYCVTSPPYYNILRNPGNGIRSDKSQFRQGVKYYTEKSNDLGNQKTYKKYLKLFRQIMKKVNKKLKKGSYCSIVISDFTVDKQETNVSGDMIEVMENAGFIYRGTIILVQNQKPLYPFGYPYAYVINHIHQNVLNFEKL